jgi:hypothetical protein
LLSTKAEYIKLVTVIQNIFSISNLLLELEYYKNNKILFVEKIVTVLASLPRIEERSLSKIGERRLSRLEEKSLFRITVIDWPSFYI